MNTKYDYLIVGQGIAGTVLAHTLMKNGKTVVIADRHNPNSSSRMAGGIVNPITGRKMVKTWLADQLFEKLHSFYSDLNESLGQAFFHKMNLFFPFENQEKQTDWLSASAEEKYETYIKGFHPNGLYDTVNGKFGGMEVTQSGYLEIGPLLDAFAKYMESKGAFIKEKVKAEELEVTDTSVKWKGIEANKLVFCEGAENVENPLFGDLDFRNVKGELLLVRFKNARFKHIINRNGFILPIDDDGTCKIGATYDYKDMSTDATEKGRIQLVEKLDALINDEYEILDQWAGIRPATYDRRPFLGTHEEFPNLAIFNGLGTKGVSLAPFFAQHLFEHLEEGKVLMPEVDHRRKKKKK
ncbi:FAD-dependent oxidoreductase [Limibacter armeniacum]|uniref:NAD(P)/FAD-dependent oxidoreductase n=1 Tax=Limibacter armeniacum TaxID=466084 RepID=UPI002FE51EFC